MKQLIDFQKIIKLRHELHSNPELSDTEFITAQRITGFLVKCNPSQIIRGLGGNGIACIFKGAGDGSSVLFRCDMDALPIEETNNFDYKSNVKDVSHKCGHDGHMAIMAGLADVFSKNPPQKGQAVLLFQPSEENGQGAARVLNDEAFKNIKVNYAFALHNLPGFSKGSVILRNNTFASASRGLIVKLYGKTSHAAEPENGLSPALAMSELIQELSAFSNKQKLFSDFALITVVHARLGEIAFGTTPGFAVVMATLRSHTNEDMEKLTSNAESLVGEITKRYSLRNEISYVEEFPATVNNKEMNQYVEEAAKLNEIESKYMKEPFKWSEDFAHFTQKFPGALFGLGSGEKYPQLHNPDYDFPDDIIEPGVKMFYGIYKQITHSEKL